MPCHHGVVHDLDPHRLDGPSWAELRGRPELAETIAVLEGIGETGEALRGWLLRPSAWLGMRVPAEVAKGDPGRVATAALRAASNAAGDLRSRVDRILRAAVSAQAALYWWESPQPELAGATPVDWLAAGRDPDVVVTAARHTAGALGH